MQRKYIAKNIKTKKKKKIIDYRMIEEAYLINRLNENEVKLYNDTVIKTLNETYSSDIVNKINIWSKFNISNYASILASKTGLDKKDIIEQCYYFAKNLLIINEDSIIDSTYTNVEIKSDIESYFIELFKDYKLISIDDEILELKALLVNYVSRSQENYSIINNTLINQIKVNPLVENSIKSYKNCIKIYRYNRTVNYFESDKIIDSEIHNFINKCIRTYDLTLDMSIINYINSELDSYFTRQLKSVNVSYVKEDNEYINESELNSIDETYIVEQQSKAYCKNYSRIRK